MSSSCFAPAHPVSRSRRRALVALACFASLTLWPALASAQEFPWALKPVHVPFDAFGYAQYPPAAPDGFASHPEVLLVENGLPAGSPLIGRMRIHHLQVTGEAPGGPLGGEITQFTGSVTLELQGTGAFAAWSREITLPAVGRFHTGPQLGGGVVQDFDVDLDQLQGQILGDPDFDLLRITSGTGFGLPTPGHAHAEFHPAGDYRFESFFDITYRIDFVGKPGGTFSGLSGSTVGVHRQRAGTHASHDLDVPDDGSGGLAMPLSVGPGHASETEAVLADPGLHHESGLVGDMHWQVVPGTVVSIPGGAYGGTLCTFDQALTLDIRGEGLFAGFSRVLTLPVSTQMELAPQAPLHPHQGVSSRVLLAFGQATGDPDFDLLRITAGTSAGLPNRGHTALVHQSGGQWRVDSFFDITYRVDFVGAPGGALAGQSGSYVGRVRCRMGAPREALCFAPDNGLGTIDFPPFVGSGWRGARHIEGLVDGLPPGSAVLMDLAIVPSTMFGTTPGGGTLGGEEQAWDARYVVNLTGTGAYSGWSRSLVMVGPVISHTAPVLTPGGSPQHWESLLWLGQAQVTGDPDFDLLRITAGNGFGLPSPGHVTLTAAPGGQWKVDSFFDITYRMDFIGAPGGTFAGLSGSTESRGWFVIGDEPTVGAPRPEAPARVALGPATPNPARHGTAFTLELPRAMHVRATLHDVAGRRVRALADGVREAGRGRFDWDGRDDGGRDVPPGLYLLRVAAGDEERTGRVIVTR